MTTIRELTLENFAGFTQVSVSFDENVTYLMGPNGAGKTTLGVTGIAFVMQGIAEKMSNPGTVIGERFRFIGPNAKTAKGSILLHDDKIGDIIVRRKMTKDGTEVSFEGPAGSNLDQQWLNDLFDIFMVNPKRFTQLSPKDQAIALGIDLSEYDNKIKKIKEEYTGINRDIKTLGTVVPVAKVEKVDVADVLETRKQYLEFNEAQTEKSILISRAEDRIEEITGEINEIETRISELQEKLAKLNESKGVGNAYIESLPQPEELKDLTELEIKLTTASETNIKASDYERYLEKVALAAKYDKQSIDNRNHLTIEESRRTAAIKAYDLPFDNLTIDEEGQLLLNGKFIKEPYFSDGELIMTVPILMASRNPQFRYVFIQGFNLLDEKKQKQIIEVLTAKGLQLCIEFVGDKQTSCNTIRLIDNVVQEEPTTFEDKPVTKQTESLI